MIGCAQEVPCNVVCIHTCYICIHYSTILWYDIILERNEQLWWSWVKQFFRKWSNLVQMQTGSWWQQWWDLALELDLPHGSWLLLDGRFSLRFEEVIWFRLLPDLCHIFGSEWTSPCRNLRLIRHLAILVSSAWSAYRLTNAVRLRQRSCTSCGACKFSRACTPWELLFSLLPRGSSHLSMALADVACGHWVAISVDSSRLNCSSMRLSRRNHFHSISVRLALAIVFEDFIHSQLLEDCEFASSMPGRFSVEF